jgi:hypothetical protein
MTTIISTQRSRVEGPNQVPSRTPREPRAPAREGPRNSTSHVCPSPPERRLRHSRPATRSSQRRSSNHPLRARTLVLLSHATSTKSKIFPLLASPRISGPSVHQHPRASRTITALGRAKRVRHPSVERTSAQALGHTPADLTAAHPAGLGGSSLRMLSPRSSAARPTTPEPGHAAPPRQGHLAHVSRAAAHFFSLRQRHKPRERQRIA